MRKIGTITFHGVTNYGALFQAYALRRVIEEKGYECEIIDYQNTTMKEQYKSFSKRDLNIKHPKQTLKKILLSPYQKKRNRAFKEFREEYLCLSKESYDENHLPDANMYDAIIAGSDQIWNFSCNGNDVHYLLDFAQETSCRCYSYAASLSTSKFTEEQIGIYKKLLSNFNQISVREQSSSDMLNKILDKPVETSVDPTLLLSSQEWRELASDVKHENYVLVFLMTHSKDILEDAFKFASERNKKIIYVNLYEPFIDKKYNSLFTVEPKEWLGLILNADYVITNSFHGTVFSILFNKQFSTCLIEDSGKNERLYQLLNITGLQSRLKTVYNTPFTEEEIDYDIVHEKLEFKRKESHAYLDNILSESIISR